MNEGKWVVGKNGGGSGVKVKEEQNIKDLHNGNKFICERIKFVHNKIKILILTQ